MLLGKLLSIVWPARCAACNGLTNEGIPFCAACDISVVPLGACCPGCAMPADPTQLCAGCRCRPFPFTRAAAALAYGGSLTKALLRFKHGRHRHLATALARPLQTMLTDACARGVQLALPVPLHPRRLRQRGFNQALELLRAGVRQSPRDLRLPIACDVLARVRDTPMLGHGSPTVRSESLKGAFALSDPARVAGVHVMVVDDVMTTGATLAECTRVLLAGGAGQVSVAAVARAIR